MFFENQGHFRAFLGPGHREGISFSRLDRNFAAQMLVQKRRPRAGGDHKRVCFNLPFRRLGARDRGMTITGNATTLRKSLELMPFSNRYAT